MKYDNMSKEEQFFQCSIISTIQVLEEKLKYKVSDFRELKNDSYSYLSIIKL